ncbi:MAG: hypothetical protein COW13_05530 [Candidatus Omnitrophica bacterium CG12_big_fil_rev_8_21_14_0_65_50_5]|nr:MAG: hypothetical protein COW13_05530 [Candidatus Omnitrophica bacterium CG12_big_fil_rev_8_21_14_0_65_50_5]
MTKKIILGLDPGTCITGYGIISVEREITVKDVGVVKPPSGLPMPERIHRIYVFLEELVEKHRPQTAVLEKLYAHALHPATAPVIGHVRGVICLLCMQKKIELIEYSVKRVRQNLTGNGNATKEQTRQFVCGQLGLDAATLTLDASDALALALGYVNMNSAVTAGDAQEGSRRPQR